MDFVLLFFVLINLFRGWRKGAVSLIFSLIEIVVISALAWVLSESVCENFAVFQNLLNSFEEFFQNLLNSIFPQEISSNSQLYETIASANIANIFKVFLAKFANSISFEGNMTIADLISSKLAKFLLRIIVFVALLIILRLLLKFVAFLTNKIVKLCGLSPINRMLGAAIGVVYGLVIFVIIYFLLLTLANVTLNASLLSFIEKGLLSQSIYTKFSSLLLSFF